MKYTSKKEIAANKKERLAWSTISVAGSGIESFFGSDDQSLTTLILSIRIGGCGQRTIIT